MAPSPIKKVAKDTFTLPLPAYDLFVSLTRSRPSGKAPAKAVKPAAGSEPKQAQK